MKFLNYFTFKSLKIFSWKDLFTDKMMCFKIESWNTLEFNAFILSDFILKTIL
jgi:hypothetical protein